MTSDKRRKRGSYCVLCPVYCELCTVYCVLCTVKYDNNEKPTIADTTLELDFVKEDLPSLLVARS